MPELPEVETNRQGLAKKVQGKRIDHLHVYWPRIVSYPHGVSQFCQRLAGQKIEELGRRGKYLLFYLSQGDVLVSHLRMEGKYFYYPASDLPGEKSKHTHLIISFSDRSQLHYHDVRKFGRFDLLSVQDLKTYFEAKGLGPEPFADSFKIEAFQKKLSKSQRAIKPFLLDQKSVAGLGNIYADEVLFRAGIHPERPGLSLSSDEVESLHAAILEVIQAAIEAGGTTIRSYLNTLGEAGSFQVDLKVYGRKGLPCPRCGHPIEKISLAQRGTHFCPQCQKKR